MEVAGERPRDQDRAVDGPFGDEGGDLVGRRVATPRADHRFAQAFDVGEEIGTAVFGDHLTQESTQETDVGTELIRHLRDGTVSIGRCDGGHISKTSDFGHNAGYRSH
ncbi:hypothetical protein Misp02_02040 [Microtetraspora sp. NBRC 16547]|nr:hypothetical protein Misp02_02040 [Microtetraspora sp. NBRC 16547]